MAPTLHTLLAFGLFLTSAYCIPAPGMSKPHHTYHPKPTAHGGPPHQVLTVQQLQTLQPLNALPSNSNVTLQYTTLGIGTQNYTCNGSVYVQSGANNGAVAVLYNTTPYLRSHPNQINNLTTYCNYQNCVIKGLKKHVLGEHYFSAAGVPTFDLYNAHPALLLSAQKIGDVKAPQAGNVDWLLLDASPSAPSNGLTEVYRIDTDGGVAPSSCSTPGMQTQIPYAAQYWFFD